jgi:uncharacterized membrane protein YccF (DUF307 family)
MERTQPRSTRYCTICGAASSADATFCRSCGRVLEIPRPPVGTVFCERCGGELSLGDTYCPTCGEPQFKGGLVRADPAAPPATTQSQSVSRPVTLGDETVFEQVSQAPNIFIRLLWFLFVGSWLGPLVWVLSFVGFITVIGIPIGLQLLHAIPFLVTLKPETRRVRLRRQPDGTIVASEVKPEQLPFKTRAIYFGLVGWWFSLIWIVMAWALMAMVFPIPVAMWMYDRLPLVTTLEQY